jgi:probable F420-dependent oxidoreductase
MKTWLIVPWVSAQDMVTLAKQADSLGFEGIMGADHAFVPRIMAQGYPYTDNGKPPIHSDMPYPDIWTTTAAMAMVTSRLKFSTAVYVLPLRHPIEVAKASAALAGLSGDRFILGAGAGWMREEFDVYGVEFSTRGKRMIEMIDVMRKLWKGDHVAYSGEFFEFPELKLVPAPGIPVPIYLGGTSRLALKRAARLAQGWIGAGNDIDEVPALLQALRQYRCEFERDSEPFETVIAVNQFDDLEALRRLEEQGMTATVFGFADYQLPLQDKLRQMESYARHYMPLLEA